MAFGFLSFYLGGFLPDCPHDYEWSSRDSSPPDSQSNQVCRRVQSLDPYSSYCTLMTLTVSIFPLALLLLFADDILLCKPISCPSDFQSDIDAIHHWTKSNHLTLNLKVHVHTPQTSTLLLSTNFHQWLLARKGTLESGYLMIQVGKNRLTTSVARFAGPGLHVSDILTILLLLHASLAPH